MHKGNSERQTRDSSVADELDKGSNEQRIRTGSVADKLDDPGKPLKHRTSGRQTSRFTLLLRTTATTPRSMDGNPVTMTPPRSEQRNGDDSRKNRCSTEETCQMSRC